MHSFAAGMIFGMKVLLLQDVRNVGRKGDIKDVSDGFARNFLILRNLGKPATESLIAEWQRRKVNEESERIKAREGMHVLQQKLNVMSISLEINVGEKGKGFKAIGAADIAAALKKQGIAIEKSKIEFPAVKEPGAYNAVIQLGEGMRATMQVIVSAKRD